jgi:ABC-type nitrate/sulfonate/bicarbonate transport system substrate-binding protein
VNKAQFLAAICLVVSVACTSTAPPAPTATTAAAAAAASSGPLKVRILVTITDRCCLNYIPALVGARLGIYEQNGLDVDWIPQVPGASAAMAATLSGQADVTVISAPGAVAAAGAGRPARLLSVDTMNAWAGMALQPEAADRLGRQGVTPQSPWMDKVKALKGLRVFGNSAGGPAEVRLRRLFMAVGVDPDADIIFQPGEPEAANAAWRSKQLDTFTCCEPITFQLVPDAVIWLEPGEPTLPIKGYDEIYATTDQFARDNPEVLRRVVAAQNHMKEMVKRADPGTSEREAILSALVAQYPSIPPELIAKSFDTGRQEFDTQTALSRQQVQDTIDGYNEGATVKVNLKAEDLAAPGFLNN